MSDNKTYYLYGSKTVQWKNQPEERRVTIAGVLVDKVLFFGKSECSPKDNFTKKKGRAIASGRAVKHPLNRVEINDSHIVGKIFVEVAKELI